MMTGVDLATISDVPDVVIVTMIPKGGYRVYIGNMFGVNLVGECCDSRETIAMLRLIARGGGKTLKQSPIVHSIRAFKNDGIELRSDGRYRVAESVKYNFDIAMIINAWLQEIIMGLNRTLDEWVYGEGEGEPSADGY